MEFVDTIEQLAVSEACLWNIYEQVAANSAFTSFYCREYWGTSASQAQLSIDKLYLQAPLLDSVRRACALESLSLAVTSHLCCRSAIDTTGKVKDFLCAILASVHGNCLVLLSLVRQEWLFSGANAGSNLDSLNGHCPANLDFNILANLRHFRQLSGQEHTAALQSQNYCLMNTLLHASSLRYSFECSVGNSSLEMAAGSDILLVVDDSLMLLCYDEATFSISAIRAAMLKKLRFCPLQNADNLNPIRESQGQDPYQRFGCEFASDAPIIWFEPLPPLFTDLSQCPRLPSAHPETYTLVLDLDETLVHHSIVDGSPLVGFRPGVGEFLRHTSLLGYELVVFTAATQDYADRCVDMVDPDHLISHRLYRQHALSWGSIYLKDLSRIGRNLNHTVIIDNIQENFMLQPNNGIFIYTWLDDPADTALMDLVPLLDEIIMTRSSVPSVLAKYRDQIPAWAGWKAPNQT